MMRRALAYHRVRKPSFGNHHDKDWIRQEASVDAKSRKNFLTLCFELILDLQKSCKNNRVSTYPSLLVSLFSLHFLPGWSYMFSLSSTLAYSVIDLTSPLGYLKSNSSERHIRSAESKTARGVLCFNKPSGWFRCLLNPKFSPYL